MDIKASQFQASMNDRYGKLDSLPPLDFIASFLDQQVIQWQKSISPIDSQINCRVIKYADSIKIIFFRETLGPNKDISWNISLDMASVSVHLELGDLSDQLAISVQDALTTNTLELRHLFESLLKRQSSLKVTINDKELLNSSEDKLLHVEELEFRDTLQSLKIQVSFEFNKAPDVLVGLWVSHAIDHLSPIYNAITPGIEFQTYAQEENSYPEGKVKYRIHRDLERNPRVIEKAKEIFRNKHNGKLFCEVCGFDFYKTYGNRGKNFAEGHHLIPVAQMKPGESTNASDIAILCSNCHSMIHRAPLLSPEKLRETLRYKD
jgi:hypothetical protein